MNEPLPHSDAELQATVQRLLDAVLAEYPDRIMAMLNPSIVSVNYNEREICFRFGLSPWMLNIVDILHGGVLSAMIDNSMGTFTRALTSRSTRTINLQVSYAAAVPPSAEQVDIYCRITALTNRFAHLFATAYALGETAATATGIFYLK